MTGPRWNTRYYLLRGNGLDEGLVMQAINRAKRRFFLRPGYMARHLGDVARLALTKQGIVWQIFMRTVFGTRVVDATRPEVSLSTSAEVTAARRS